MTKKHPQRRFQIIGGVFFFLVLLFAVFSLINGQNSTASTDEDGRRVSPEVGAVAPNFELLSSTGESMTLSDFKGKPVAVMFMHTW